MEKINEIIQASASLEGCTLNTAEYALLLNEGISSAGKTIDEQLLCLDLLNGYKKCYSFAQAREFWSVFRIKSIAEVALRHSPASGLDIKEERIVQKVCDLANTQRLHIHEHRAEEMYRTSFEIHYLISVSRPWAYGNDFIGRLLMNYLQYECRLEPTIIRPSQRAEYKRLLNVATKEEIGEIFVSYMMEHRCDAPEPEKVVKMQDNAASTKNAKPSSRELILSLLREHPYMSAKDLSEQIGISPKGVEKNLKILKENGALNRVGPDKGGRWEVLA